MNYSQYNQQSSHQSNQQSGQQYQHPQMQKSMQSKQAAYMEAQQMQRQQQMQMQQPQQQQQQQQPQYQQYQQQQQQNTNQMYQNQYGQNNYPQSQPQTQISHPMPPSQNHMIQIDPSKDEFWYSMHCPYARQLYNLMMNNEELCSKFQCLSLDKIPKQSRPHYLSNKTVPLIVHNSVNHDGNNTRNIYEGSNAYEWIRQLSNQNQCQLGSISEYDPSSMGGSGFSDGFASLEASTMQSLVESSGNYTNQEQPSWNGDHRLTVDSNMANMATSGNQESYGNDETAMKMKQLEDQRSNDPYIGKAVARYG